MDHRKYGISKETWQLTCSVSGNPFPFLLSCKIAEKQWTRAAMELPEWVNPSWVVHQQHVEDVLQPIFVSFYYSIWGSMFRLDQCRLCDHQRRQIYLPLSSIGSGGKIPHKIEILWICVLSYLCKKTKPCLIEILWICVLSYLCKKT